MSKEKKIYLWSGVVFVIDQMIKILIRANLKMFQEKVVIPHFLSLYYMENKGAAFGIFKNSSILLILVALICLVFLISMVHKEKEFSFWSFSGFSLLIGGILGNLCDRFFCGGVTDYLAFMLFHHQFPVFNFADMTITIGVVLFLISSFVELKKE